jgi:hypothetical protein
MSKTNNVWYGYLEAGAKSSPVIRDDKLETGSSKTVYLFNLNQNKISEYNLQIVGSKLRELKKDEEHFIAELDKAFPKARLDFTNNKKRNFTLTPQPVTIKKSPPPVPEDDEEIPEFADEAGDWDLDDE